MKSLNVKVTYRLELSAKEFSLIRRALEKFGTGGAELVTELMARQKAAMDDITRHFKTVVEMVHDENKEDT